MLDTGAYTKLDAAGVAGVQYFVLPITLDTESPLSVPEIRRAIYTYGIDWDTMADSLGGGTYYHTDAFGLTGNTYYNEDLEFTNGPDYAKAKELLAAAGYSDGFSIEIYYGIGGQIPPGLDVIATYMQAELAKIGVTAECIPVDGTVLMNDYLKTGTAASTGLVINGMFFTPLQTQRLNQMFNPKGTMGGATAWSDKLVELFAKVNSAMTLEEQNKALHDYVVQYVQVDSNYWPVYNSRTVEFYQQWCHYSSNARIGNAGFDPHEIWVDQH
jgi:peptide/nickel transport system substrate-binding protein